MLKARIKPYDRAKGHVMRTLVMAELSGRKFVVGKVYDVTEAEAKILSRVRSRIDSIDGPMAFDIGTEAEMALIMSSEAKLKLGLTPEVIKAIRETSDGTDVSRADDAKSGALTVADLPGATRSAPAPVATQPSQRRRGARGG